LTLPTGISGDLGLGDVLAFGESLSAPFISNIVF
jgi:hypothetical protein